MYTDDLATVPLCPVVTKNDAGVTFDEDMTFRQEINLLATKATNIMGIVRRIYTYHNIDTLKLLFKTLVRQHLEYGAPL